MRRGPREPALSAAVAHEADDVPARSGLDLPRADVAADRAGDGRRLTTATQFHVDTQLPIVGVRLVEVEQLPLA